MASVAANATLATPIAWNLSDTDRAGIADFWADVSESSSSVTSVGDYLVFSGLSSDGAVKSQWLGFTGNLLSLITWAVNDQTVLTLKGASVDVLGQSAELRFEDLFAANDRIEMAQGADYVNGYAGLDTLYGGGGSDTLIGGQGNDGLDGGADTDTAEYSYPANSYSLRLSAQSATIVYSGPIIQIYPPPPTEGTDTLTNIERLRFTDKTIRIDVKAHGSYADLPDTLYQFFVVGFGAAPGVTYMDQMAEAYRYWLPEYKENTVKQIVEAFTTKTQFTSVYPQALYRTEGGKYYAYAHDASLAGNPLVRGNEVTKAAFDAQMASLAKGLVETIVKTSASEATKTAAATDVQAALGLGGDWTIGKVIYTVFGNLATKPVTDPVWGGTAKQFANQVAVAKYYTDTLSQSTDDVATLRSVMAAVTNTTDVSSDDAIASLIGVALLNGPGI
jgi:hypothetical protein